MTDPHASLCSTRTAGTGNRDQPPRRTNEAVRLLNRKINFFSGWLCGGVRKGVQNPSGGWLGFFGQGVEISGEGFANLLGGPVLSGLRRDNVDVLPGRGCPQFDVLGVENAGDREAHGGPQMKQIGVAGDDSGADPHQGHDFGQIVGLEQQGFLPQGLFDLVCGFTLGVIEEDQEADTGLCHDLCSSITSSPQMNFSGDTLNSFANFRAVFKLIDLTPLSIFETC